MIKSSELKLSESEIVAEGVRNGNEVEEKLEKSLLKDCCRNEEKIPKFTMIFNKYHSKLNKRSSAKNHNDGKSKDNKSESKYTMIFNKDVTIRPTEYYSLESLSKTDLKKAGDGGKSEMDVNGSIVSCSSLRSMKLNDAETLMNLYGRSNLFIPELTISSLSSENGGNAKNGSNDKRVEMGVGEKARPNDSGLRLYNSLTCLTKNRGNRRADNAVKNKIASLTSLETHSSRDAPRKHLSSMQERKLFRVRSLDLSESVSSSDSDLDRSFGFQKHGCEDNQMGKESGGEMSDKKSRGDAARKGDNAGRKQVQWKSEVDVIYFESHLAADGDRSGEILGRVMEPLREEWEQQRTGFYAKMVPLPLGTHFNERWQSLLKI